MISMFCVVRFGSSGHWVWAGSNTSHGGLGGGSSCLSPYKLLSTLWYFIHYTCQKLGFP